MPPFISKHELFFAGCEVLPDRGHAAEIFHNARDLAQHMIDLLLGVLLAERETQRAVRYLVRTADGKQNVARIKRAGRARAAGGGTDARLVEQEKKALALDALKAEVHVAGETLRFVAVERRVRDGLESGDELIAQSAYIRRVFLEIRARLGKRRRHGARIRRKYRR